MPADISAIISASSHLAKFLGGLRLCDVVGDIVLKNSCREMQIIPYLLIYSLNKYEKLALG